MRVFLVRHGQTEWNITNRAQGHVDIALNETGQFQAKALGQLLVSLDIKRILTSDLVRCQQSIAPYLAKVPLQAELRVDLRERTFGTMEGQNYSDLHAWMREEAHRLGVPDWEVRPTEGESMADVWNRLDSVEKTIRDETQTVLVVSHGGALAQLLAKLIKGTAETPRSFRFSNCGVTTLARRPNGSFLLERFDECPERGML